MKYLIIICILFRSGPSNAQRIGPDVKRIVFLGNSITYNGAYINDVEAYLLAFSPAIQYDIINLGLPSETVSGLSEEGHANGKFPRPDLHERLARVMTATKPDMILACYGMNDGIYLPLDSNRFRLFRDGIEWLHAQVVKSGARLVHITPPVYDERKNPGIKYSAVLKRYSGWLMSLRKDRKWEVIDVHSPMVAYLEAHRKVDDAFHLDGFALAVDGVHPAETGHWIIAREILSYLGFKAANKFSSIEEALKAHGHGLEILNLVRRKHQLSRDAWLTETKHTRPGIVDGLPIVQALDSVTQINARLKLLITVPSHN